VSKVYVVHVARRAVRDLQAIYDWIASDSISGAGAWLSRIQQEIKKLAYLPGRCRLAREAASVGDEVRQLIVGRYRVLFVIRGLEVHVLHIRHSARDVADRDELL